MRLILTAISFLWFSTLVVHAQSVTPHGRVIIEEEEVTLFDEAGREVETRYVRKDGMEKATLVRQAREKVLKRMGLKSIAETKGNKKLNQQYRNELRRFVKIRDLKPLNIKFVDKNNGVIKEVPICPPGSGQNNINIATMTIEAWRAKGYSLTDNEAAKKKVEHRVSREAVVSKSQNAVIVSELNSGFVVPVSSKEIAHAERGGGELGTDSSIEYYDVKGNMRWEKKSDSNLIFYPVSISEAGDLVATIKRCEYGCRKVSELGAPLQELYVYDSLGKEVLALPMTKDMCFSYNGGFWFSQKGDYIKVDCAPEKGFPKSIFIDVRAKKVWRAPYLVGIGTGDDGYEIREGDVIRVVATNEQMRNSSLNLDLGKLSWEKLQ